MAPGGGAREGQRTTFLRFLFWIGAQMGPRLPPESPGDPPDPPPSPPGITHTPKMTIIGGLRDRGLYLSMNSSTFCGSLQRASNSTNRMEAVGYFLAALRNLSLVFLFLFLFRVLFLFLFLFVFLFLFPCSCSHFYSYSFSASYSYSSSYCPLGTGSIKKARWRVGRRQLDIYRCDSCMVLQV